MSTPTSPVRYAKTIESNLLPKCKATISIKGYSLEKKVDNWSHRNKFMQSYCIVSVSETGLEAIHIPKDQGTAGR
jgi:hypothetical protein